MSFGNVVLGSSSDLTVAVSNAGTANLNITSKSITGADASRFSIQSGDGAITLTPGTSQNVTVRFTPGNTGAVTASLSIASDDPDENPFTIALNGTGTAPEINVSPTSYAFGNQEIYTSTSTSFTVTNQGTATLNITASSITGANAGEFGISNGGAFTLAAGANRVLSISFNPTSAGAKTASLHIVSNDADESTLDLALTGTGIVIPDIAVNPTSSNLRSVLLGSYSEATITVSNTGTGTLSISATILTGANTDQFNIQSGSGQVSFSLQVHEYCCTFTPYFNRGKIGHT